MIPWINLSDSTQLQDILNNKGYSLIFKHSNRCSISMMAKRNFEMDAAAIPSDVNLYFLDLIRYRTLSSEIATVFNIRHESPQVLLISGGKCIFNASHEAIEVGETLNHLIY